MSHTTGLQKAAAAGVAGIAVATFATSFHALTGLAVETGATVGWLAPMLPVALDGMVVAASMAVIAARRTGRPAGYSWFLVGLYTSLSVAGNAAHAAARGPLAAFIAAAFPLTLFLSFEQLLRITTAPDRATGRERGAEEARSAPGPREDRNPVASLQVSGGASAPLPVLTDWSSGSGSALRPRTSAAGDAEARAGVAGDARARVRAVWEAHQVRGGDPAELTDRSDRRRGCRLLGASRPRAARRAPRRPTAGQRRWERARRHGRGRPPISAGLPPGSQGCPPEEVVEPQAGLPTVEQVLAAKPTGCADWDRQAACSSSEHDPELWWPTGHTDSAVEARRVCAGCPVLGDCRDAFLARPGDRDGIWAGLRGYDLLKAARRPAPAVDRLARLTTPARQPRQDPSNVLAADERTPSPTRGMR